MRKRLSGISARHLFALNLRRLRRAKELSQDQLGHLAGIHRTYVGAVERSEKNISIDSMEKLATALDCSVSDLLQESK